MRKAFLLACLTLASLFTLKANDVTGDNWVDAYGNPVVRIRTGGAAGVNSLLFTGGLTTVSPKITPIGDANLNVDIQAKGTGAVRLLDGNANVVFQAAAAVASAVNGIVFTNAVTGAAPVISPGGTGSDTNIMLRLASKGTGQVATDGATLIQNASAGGMSASTPFFPTTAAASATVTAAQLQSGVYVVTASATTTLTLPTAALIVAANPGCKVNDIIYWDVRNEATTTTTVAVGAGITSEAGNTLTIATVNTRRFALLITNVGTPAIQLFSLGVSAH